MNEQIPLPELPPMKTAAPASMPPPAPVYAQPAKPAMGTKRLRQAIGYVAGGGFTLVLMLCGGELVLRDGLRPTDLMATIEARTELGVMNQKMGVQPGQMVMTEPQYREKMAEAQRSGQAKAELSFQEKLAVVQADKERVVAAYQTLFSRANLIAQAAIQLETVTQQFRQRLLEMSNGGRAMVIAVYDGLCALGQQDSCKAAHDARANMIGEATELSEGDVTAKVRALLSGIDDPATFITHEDERRHGTPHLHRR